MNRTCSKEAGTLVLFNMKEFNPPPPLSISFPPGYSLGWWSGNETLFLNLDTSEKEMLTGQTGYWQAVS